jgi:hypothetical protein
MATSTKSRKRSSGRVVRSRHPVSRRRGVTARQSRHQRGGLNKVALIAGGVALALVVAVVALISRAEDEIKECCDSLGPIASVVFDQATANTESVPMNGLLGDAVRRAADEHRSIQLVGIDGDGAVVSNEFFDMTPRLPNGTVLKVEPRAEEVTAANLELVGQKLNGGSPSVPGQALFLGLERLQLDTSVPIFVVSSLLDTADPLDMRRLGWDVAPDDVVRELKESGELPNLNGADVTFVVRPVAGEQEQLRQPQVEYRESLWTGLVVASGAFTARTALSGAPTGGHARSRQESRASTARPGAVCSGSARSAWQLCGRLARSSADAVGSTPMGSACPTAPVGAPVCRRGGCSSGGRSVCHPLRVVPRGTGAQSAGVPRPERSVEHVIAPVRRRSP